MKFDVAITKRRAGHVDDDGRAGRRSFVANVFTAGSHGMLVLCRVCTRLPESVPDLTPLPRTRVHLSPSMRRIAPTLPSRPGTH
ncbi:hypothetical protein [Hyphomicrobium sp.]|uniref:hypothetical protein n=1 Tax=Hyphomicrobium sp. TaxID=82 RepID=UPI0025C34E5E|nr:hypothetical protein [Hyphomicrobium sp.]MCC7250489.1 hypothetical protein [Hyphomicrobium sp.]